MPDTYCTICCGPLVEVRIASKPRAEAFKTAQQRGNDSGMDEDIGVGERSYDCKFISEKETAWTMSMMLLGFNSIVRGPTKQGSYSALEHRTIADTSFSIAFLAPFGIYESNSTVAVEDSPNGSFTVHDVGNNTNYFECYDGYRMTVLTRNLHSHFIRNVLLLDPLAPAERLRLWRPVYRRPCNYGQECPLYCDALLDHGILSGY